MMMRKTGGPPGQVAELLNPDRVDLSRVIALGRAAVSSSIREKAFTTVNRSGTKLEAKRRHRRSSFDRPTRWGR